MQYLVLDKTNFKFDIILALFSNNTVNYNGLLLISFGEYEYFLINIIYLQLHKVKKISCILLPQLYYMHPKYIQMLCCL